MLMPEDLRGAVAALAGSAGLGAIRDRHRGVSDGYRNGEASSRLIHSSDDIAAYLLARMPATYAAVRTALAALRDNAPDFAPQSALDVGCGPGTALFAAVEAFPTLTKATGLDHNARFLDAACQIGANIAPPNATFHFAKGDLLRLPRDANADVVLASYTLVELAERQAEAAVAALWSVAAHALVLVEPGSPAGFARLVAARRRLIADGAVILAPCTHQQACPMVAPDWCHFSVRLPRSRAHLVVKSAKVPFEDEKFSYLVAARAGAPLAAGRIIAPVQHGKAGHSLRICTNGRIDGTVIRPRDADFKAAKKWDWGDGV